MLGKFIEYDRQMDDDGDGGGGRTKQIHVYKLLLYGFETTTNINLKLLAKTTLMFDHSSLYFHSACVCEMRFGPDEQIIQIIERSSGFNEFSYIVQSGMECISERTRLHCIISP